MFKSVKNENNAEIVNDKTGEKFDLGVFLSARVKCIAVTEKIISQISAGLNEQDIKKIIEAEFRNIGVNKFWHPTKIRIGSDTTKNFRELSNPQLKTKINEICFLDLGPIIDDHEADFGRTFLVGSDKENELIRASQQVFQETSEIWRSKGVTGTELFSFASTAAAERGYKLNPLMAGHRLGDFPHKLFSSDKLFELGRTPTENLWVLEIHLIDEKSNTGAFFEDILLSEQ